jgi:hypothetical protein
MPLADITRAFDRQGLHDTNDKQIDVSDMVMIMLPLYERVHREYADLLKSLPLAIDMCLNCILNIYDA